MDEWSSGYKFWFELPLFDWSESCSILLKIFCLKYEYEWSNGTSFGPVDFWGVTSVTRPSGDQLSLCARASKPSEIF